MTALSQPRRRPVRRVAVWVAVAVVTGLGLATTVSCSLTAVPPTSSRPTSSPTAGSSQVSSSSTPSSPAPTSAPALLNDHLIAAAWAADVPTARRLIEAGADVNHLSSTTESAFHIAASEGHLELLELTLARGADISSLDSYRGTALIRAAERGHAMVVGRLLQTPIKVNHVNRRRYTALHEAIILGRPTPSYADTVRLLVARGADVTLPAGELGHSPLDVARDRGYTPVIATLEAALAAKPVDAPTASAALLVAATTGAVDAVAIALRQGADLEVKDGNGRTPLILAAANDRVDVARLLVALGARKPGLDLGLGTLAG